MCAPVNHAATTRRCSSVARTSAFQAERRGFESRHLLSLAHSSVVEHGPDKAGVPRSSRGGPMENNMKCYWLSSKKMTVLVEVQDGRIIQAAPVVRKFIGQPVQNLIRWMRKQGGLRIEELDARVA